MESVQQKKLKLAQYKLPLYFFILSNPIVNDLRILLIMTGQDVSHCASTAGWTQHPSLQWRQSIENPC